MTFLKKSGVGLNYSKNRRILCKTFQNNSFQIRHLFEKS